MCQLEYMNKPGKRSPEITPGLGVYEGEFNRDVMLRALGMALHAGVDAVPLVSGPVNVPLKQRVKTANEIQRKKGESRLISIHANAAGMGDKWNKARGFKVFHKKGAESENLASEMEFNLHCHLTPYTPSRGRAVGNFTILKVAMPAILVESPFMTNKEDARLLASNDFREIEAMAIFDTLMSYQYRC
jgi:N-acetylmuramoyl-L-alanine amidase